MATLDFPKIGHIRQTTKTKWPDENGNDKYDCLECDGSEVDESTHPELYGKLSFTADEYFDNVKLLLHFEGTDGSTTFTDSSNDERTATVADNVEISASRYKLGAASGYFNQGYLTWDSSTDFDPSEDWTVELFFYATNATTEYPHIFILGSGSYERLTLWIDAGTMRLYTRPDYVTENTQIVEGPSISDSTWYHVAVTSNSGTYELFVDGVSQGTGTPSSSVVPSGAQQLVLGYQAWGTSTSDYLLGNIDEFRFTGGIVRYTEDFTPTTKPLPNSSVVSRSTITANDTNVPYKIIADLTE